MPSVFSHLLARILVLLSVAVSLPACLVVPIPPVWDIGNLIRRLHEVDVGTTTKAEVIEIFGKPPRYRSAAVTEPPMPQS